MKDINKKLENFTNKVLDKFGDIFDLSEVIYKDNRTKVKIICKIHGIFEVTPSNFLSKNKYGCPKCGQSSENRIPRTTIEEYINKANIIHSNKYLYNLDRIQGHEKICIICPEHGEFTQDSTSHLQGHGCPKCCLKSQTSLFNKLSKEFPSLEIMWEYSPEWLGRQRFDIAIPVINLAIEYNGKQHYVPMERFGGIIGFNKTIERDSLKKDKCINNNWEIIELKYDYSNEEYESMVEYIQNKTVSYA